MAVQIQFEAIARQAGDRLMKLIGLIGAQEVAKLMDAIGLKPNPRSPNVNRITKAIVRTLEDGPELLQYKTKGLLLAGKFLKADGKICHFDFDSPTYGGILDGGHNFFALCREMVIDAVRATYASMKAEDKRLRKKAEQIKSWQDLKDQWDVHSDVVKKFIVSVHVDTGNFFHQPRRLERKYSYLLPVEILSPVNDTSDKEVSQMIHEISVARNNNVQLKDFAIAQHKGSYEYLKQVLPDELNKKIQWKSGENQHPIIPTKIIALALVPLRKLYDADIVKKIGDAVNNVESEDGDNPEEVTFSEVKLMSMYTSTAACISNYSQIVDAVSNLADEGRDEEDLKSVVTDSLEVVAELPELWDELEVNFQGLYEVSCEGLKPYAELPCNKKGPAKKESPTRFFSKQIQPGKYVACAGFLAPLFSSIAMAFTTYNPRPQEKRVKWIVNVKKILDEFSNPSPAFKKVMSAYIKLMGDQGYDPQKFGKNSMSYSVLGQYACFENWVSYVKKS